MAEYIDRGNIQKEACWGCRYNICVDGCSYPEPCEKLLAAFLDAEPAADVAPVVRCQECNYWNRSSEMMPDGEEADYGWCDKMLDSDSEMELITTENDFCSYGERRENEV